MRMSKLTSGCLILLTAFLAAYTTSPTSGNSTNGALSCPTANNFYWDDDDFGWTGGPCGGQNIVERYLVFSGSGWTQPVEIEIQLDDIYCSGTTTQTWWETKYPGSPRYYIGQNWTDWNDINCDGSMDCEEVVYHSYSLTGNTRCGTSR